MFCSSENIFVLLNLQIRPQVWMSYGSTCWVMVCWFTVQSFSYFCLIDSRRSTTLSLHFFETKWAISCLFVVCESTLYFKSKRPPRPNQRPFCDRANFFLYILPSPEGSIIFIRSDSRNLVFPWNCIFFMLKWLCCLLIFWDRGAF